MIIYTFSFVHVHIALWGVLGSTTSDASWPMPLSRSGMGPKRSTRRSAGLPFSTTRSILRLPPPRRPPLHRRRRPRPLLLPSLLLLLLLRHPLPFSILLRQSRHRRHRPDLSFRGRQLPLPQSWPPPRPWFHHARANPGPLFRIRIRIRHRTLGCLMTVRRDSVKDWCLRVSLRPQILLYGITLPRVGPGQPNPLRSRSRLR